MGSIEALMVCLLLLALLFIVPPLMNARERTITFRKTTADTVSVPGSAHTAVWVSRISGTHGNIDLYGSFATVKFTGSKDVMVTTLNTPALASALRDAMDEACWLHVTIGDHDRKWMVGWNRLRVHKFPSHHDVVLLDLYGSVL